jgi:hypothetical protein
LSVYKKAKVGNRSNPCPNSGKQEKMTDALQTTWP